MLRFAIIQITLLPLVTPAYGAEGTFNYDRPDLWLDIPGSSCSGMKNSPIAIDSSTECTAFGEYEMLQGSCTFNDMDFMVTDHSVNMIYPTDKEVTCTKPSFTIPDNDISDIFHHANVHIHLSSEHTIDGNFYPAEMHMVHMNEAGTRAAVLGSMIEVGTPFDHPIFEIYLKAWEAARSDIDCRKCDIRAEGMVDLSYPMTPYDMLVSNDYYHYDGGLTTPQCTEIVWWNFNSQSIHISVKQYLRLTDIILNTHTEIDGECKPLSIASVAGSTSRPVQPLNGRIVQKICNRMDMTPKSSSKKSTKAKKVKSDKKG